MQMYRKNRDSSNQSIPAARPGASCIPRLAMALAAATAMLGSRLAVAQPAESWRETSGLVAANGLPGAGFGHSCAIDGGTAVIGAWTDSSVVADGGSVYVFGRTSDGWTQAAKLALNLAAGDNFGYSVDIEGDTMIVGAPNTDAPAIDSGAAYVYKKVAGTWIQQAKLTPSDPTSRSAFGYSVGISGAYLVISAVLDDGVGTNSGAVYVFHDAGGSWVQHAKVIPADAAALDNFGISVKISGDTLISGAYGRDDRGPASGAAYVYRRESGLWVQKAKLTAADGLAGDNFGLSVGINGSAIIVGAPYADAGGLDSGAAYVFHESGGVWSQAAKLAADDGAEGDLFGYRVAIQGDLAVVGAWSDDDRGAESGSASVFRNLPSGWMQVAHLTGPGGKAHDQFGVGLAINGSTILVGARNNDAMGADSGAAYVFDPLCAADLNGDGQVDFADYLEFLNLFDAGC